MIRNFKYLIFFTLIGVNCFGQTYMRRAFQPAHVINKIPYGANNEFGNYVQANDASIYYEVYGNGQPIVLLHGGLFGSIMEYADLIDKLKHHFKVIAISTRGHGKSTLGREPLTLEQRARDVLAVINQVTKDSVILIGFSDGGYTAYTFGAKYPEKVKKMVVIGAGELKPGYRDFNFNAKSAIELDTLFWQQQLKLMPDSNRLEDLFKQVSTCYSKVTVGKDLLSKIKCPVLLMAGDNDTGNPVERIFSAASFIPEHYLSIIPNVGHGCHNDNFEACWAAMGPFIDFSTKNYISLNSKMMVPHQVNYSFTTIRDFKVIKVLKDSTVKPVDEPTFVKIKDVTFQDGIIEVKVLARLLPTASPTARGFIGVAFRINENNSEFESIYIRPTNGRAEQQIRRNHSIQYFSYPNFKFDRLRKESPEVYESYADMVLDEWITLKIVVKGSSAKLFLNNQTEPSLIVSDLKLGASNLGNIGLWVEEGTEGYFRDLIITKE